MWLRHTAKLIPPYELIFLADFKGVFHKKTLKLPPYVGLSLQEKSLLPTPKLDSYNAPNSNALEEPGDKDLGYRFSLPTLEINAPGYPATASGISGDN